MDLTTMDDAAAYVAATALDPATLGHRVMVAGDEISARGVAAAYRAATGRPLVERRLGAIEDGERELERRRAAGAPILETLALIYGVPMMAGRGKLQPLDNARYPEIVPTRVEAFLRAGASAGGGKAA
jgi:hypothetical protein